LETTAFEPLHVPSLKQACIHRLQQSILSGQLRAAERLPAERDLARQMGVSRPVVHEALVELAAQGLVTIQPRHGVRVNDFRKVGSITLLTALLDHSQGRLEPELFESMLGFRRMIEAESAREAARRRTPEQLDQFFQILQKEAQTDPNDDAALTELDFAFHLLVAVSSGNLVFPMLINSFKRVYTSITGLFFDRYHGSPAIAEVGAYQQQLVEAIARSDAPAAGQIMLDMLAHGERLLKGGQDGMHTGG
jgi:GntR family transcriptional regulator, transcriptional repressor for pyruvate dehydrogenase complex